MKVVILAGGLGTRLSEETTNVPKPMVEIGGRPIIWHIMKSYSHYGLDDFVVCCGYKGYVLKEYFANYFLHLSDFQIDLSSNSITTLSARSENWRVSLFDTGETTQTGGRLKRVADQLDGPFCLTYGDGVSDVNLSEVIAHHKKSGCLATVTAVQPPGRFGSLNIDEGRVLSFREKPVGDGSWINGGFFVLEPEVINRIHSDNTIWEQEPLESLAAENQLAAYKHGGFWRPMDTLRDKITLNELWDRNNAPWKVWD